MNDYIYSTDDYGWAFAAVVWGDLVYVFIGLIILAACGKLLWLFWKVLMKGLAEQELDDEADNDGVLPLSKAVVGEVVILTSGKNCNFEMVWIAPARMRLTNVHGQSVEANFRAVDFSTTNRFREWVLNQGNFCWAGSKDELFEIIKKSVAACDAFVAKGLEDQSVRRAGTDAPYLGGVK